MFLEIGPGEESAAVGELASVTYSLKSEIVETALLPFLGTPLPMVITFP